jgi:hypothetical protein
MAYVSKGFHFRGPEILSYWGYRLKDCIKSDSRYSNDFKMPWGMSLINIYKNLPLRSLTIFRLHKKIWREKKIKMKQTA